MEGVGDTRVPHLQPHVSSAAPAGLGTTFPRSCLLPITGRTDPIDFFSPKLTVCREFKANVFLSFFGIEGYRVLTLGQEKGGA